MAQFKRDQKNDLSLSVDNRSYFFRNKVPCGPPEGAGLRLFISKIQKKKRKQTTLETADFTALAEILGVLVL